eukprot:scaffold687_cov138-Skeletonema_menzelii.AAC.8
MEKWYFDEVLRDLPPEDMDGTAVTPAADHFLFRTLKMWRSSTMNEQHYFIVSRHNCSYFASQRARPDLRTAVSFLMTKRVQSPDEDDYKNKKLARAIRYVRRTKFLRLKVEAHALIRITGLSMGLLLLTPFQVPPEATLKGKTTQLGTTERRNYRFDVRPNAEKMRENRVEIQAPSQLRE